MNNQELMLNTLWIYVACATVLSILLAVVGRYVLVQFNKEEYMHVLRIGNLEIYILAVIGVFLVTQGSLLLTIAMISISSVCCYLIDLILFEKDEVFDWLVPEHEEQE